MRALPGTWRREHVNRAKPSQLPAVRGRPPAVRRSWGLPATAPRLLRGTELLGVVNGRTRVPLLSRYFCRI